MRLSDLQTKDIVNINDGKRVGRIIDAEINPQGHIIYLVIEAKRAIRNFITSHQIPKLFTKKSKIGGDVILIKF